MDMTNAELIATIRNEIERLYAQHSSKYGTDEAGLVLDRLEDFLSTLESEKPVPNDLEQRWDELQTNFSEINEAFEAGKKEQKEQMMKEAVSGWLDEDNEPPYDLNVICEEKIPFGKFKHGDKVRIIILPKED